MPGKLNGLLVVISLCLGTVLLTAPSADAATFNVKAFGAKGDGVTDDQVAIQNALNAASSSPGSLVIFPVGNYLHSGELTGTSIGLQGVGATLTATTGLQTLRLTGNKVSVSNLKFNTQVTNTDELTVFIDSANGFTVHNLVINGNVGIKPISSILVDNGTNGTVSGCDLFLNGSPSSAGITVVDSSTVLVSQNLVTGAGTGVEAVSSSNINCAANKTATGAGGIIGVGVTTMAVTNSLVTNLSSGAQGITLVNSTNLTVSDNRIMGNNTVNVNSEGIESVGNTNVLIKANNIQSCGILSVGDSAVQILGNSIFAAMTGVECVGDANLYVQVNQIANCQGSAIAAVGISQTLSISQNIMRDCGLTGAFMGGAAAVVFVDSPPATSIPITSNLYTGSVKNLSFFIDCTQASPPALLAGNKTNTLLPSTP